MTDNTILFHGKYGVEIITKEHDTISSRVLYNGFDYIVTDESVEYYYINIPGTFLQSSSWNNTGNTRAYRYYVFPTIEGLEFEWTCYESRDYHEESKKNKENNARRLSDHINSGNISRGIITAGPTVPHVDIIRGSGMIIPKGLEDISLVTCKR